MTINAFLLLLVAGWVCGAEISKRNCGGEVVVLKYGRKETCISKWEWYQFTWSVIGCQSGEIWAVWVFFDRKCEN